MTPVQDMGYRVEDEGRAHRQADPALAVPVEPAGSLDPSGVDPLRGYSPFEYGERQALLQVRSFIIKHGLKEVDAYCAQRLHDIEMDARR